MNQIIQNILVIITVLLAVGYLVQKFIWKPKKAKDFELFFSLVDFLSSFLPTIRSDLFPRWIYIFGKVLISRSNDFPLVSGYYKLFSMTLDIARQHSYFSSISRSDYVTFSQMHATPPMPTTWDSWTTTCSPKPLR